ncbi:MAG TPA: hypothetical protein VOA78_06310 [Candidatus Dormibacteraeota bacterium]|nr:hypothetical protein [Candidatus Dormibacteraeota bacterium]
MKRTGFAIVGGMLLVGSAVAGQTPSKTPSGSPGGAQASAQASGQASAEVGKSQTSGSAAAGSSASAQAGHENGALASGTSMNAVLNAPVDSKKAKPGDEVTARTTEAVKADGKTVIPKGTKLVGHVTQASARGKGEAESSLGVVFDRAILKNGQEMPVNAGIQALAAAQTNSAVAGSDVDAVAGAGGSAGGYGAAGGRGALGGVGATAGGAVGTVTNTAGNVGGVAGNTAGGAVNAASSVGGASKGAIGGVNAAGQLTSNSQGVFGLNGLNLSSASSNDTQGSLITSTGKNVHLDSGTRMLLVTQSEAGKQNPGAKPEARKPEREPKSEKPVKQ